MSSMLFSSQPITPSPLSRNLPTDGDVLEHMRVRAVKHDLPPRTTRSRSSSQSSASSSSSGASSPATTTTASPDKRWAYGDFMGAFLPSSPHHVRPPFSRRGSSSSSFSEDDHTLTPIRLMHASESSRDIAQAFNGSDLSAQRRDSVASLSSTHLTPPGSPSPYLTDGRRKSVRSLVSSNSRESLRRLPPVTTNDLYYTPPESPFTTARRAMLQSPEPVVEEEDITACYGVLGFRGFGI
ncbi:hypothetical protein PENSPDRAFT_153633 [Peniophora sp. CONT]|nr:hypothetical protein PENSPDRAFT_153633 [Peniophora sp. CONT]